MWFSYDLLHYFTAWHHFWLSARTTRRRSSRANFTDEQDTIAWYLTHDPTDTKTRNISLRLCAPWHHAADCTSLSLPRLSTPSAGIFADVVAADSAKACSIFLNAVVVMVTACSMFLWAFTMQTRPMQSRLFETGVKKISTILSSYVTEGSSRKSNPNLRSETVFYPGG